MIHEQAALFVIKLSYFLCMWTKNWGEFQYRLTIVVTKWNKYCHTKTRQKLHKVFRPGLTNHFFQAVLRDKAKLTDSVKIDPLFISLWSENSQFSTRISYNILYPSCKMKENVIHIYTSRNFSINIGVFYQLDPPYLCFVWYLGTKWRPCAVFSSYFPRFSDFKYNSQNKTRCQASTKDKWSRKYL